MIKITYCLTRKPGMSRAEFQDYWFNNHAPLVARHRKALRIQRYVQLHTGDFAATDPIRASRAGSLEKAPAIYDGVAQLWWATLDDLAATGTEPEAIAAGRELLEDEAKFIDFSKSPLWFGEEKTIFG
ncbi:MAG TPA: EthD domain-containing protein [Parvibaculum sp.]|uniref:EthD domain-containing protein n=1 Tax=Parvibaculum sp. TaxID=2024848 RepID=UPI002C55165E|nr:EthD domain-containing protein [Parvibaculum sp.]HMM13547.1 EthD domain-containing protein [Parvibaculum sp.]